MAKILITGGRGFIGTNLTQELRSRGHEVFTSDIKDGEDPHHFRADVSAFEQMDWVFREVGDVDFVYQLAAEYGRWNGEDHYRNLWETNVVGNKNMIRLQERHGFRTIFFSSAEVYGDYEGVMSESVMDEIPIKQMNDYAISKWVGELQCLNSAEMFGTETVRVRPVNCYGPHEYFSRYRGVIPIFTYSCLVGREFSVYSGHRRIFDYVSDTVRTVANIADNFIAGEVYNVGSNEDWDVDIGELARLVLSVTGADPSLATMHESEPHTTKVKRMDFSKIRRDLAHEANVPLEDGLRLYAEWMQSVYVAEDPGE